MRVIMLLRRSLSARACAHSISLVIALRCLSPELILPDGWCISARGERGWVRCWMQVAARGASSCPAPPPVRIEVAHTAPFAIGVSRYSTSTGSTTTKKIASLREPRGRLRQFYGLESRRDPPDPPPNGSSTTTIKPHNTTTALHSAHRAGTKRRCVRCAVLRRVRAL